MTNEEIMKTLKENFPVLTKLSGKFEIKVSDDEKLYFVGENDLTQLSQQDCLELSQLFALLATGFDGEVE